MGAPAAMVPAPRVTAVDSPIEAAVALLALTVVLVASVVAAVAAAPRINPVGRAGSVVAAAAARSLVEDRAALGFLVAPVAMGTSLVFPAAGVAGLDWGGPSSRAPARFRS